MRLTYCEREVLDAVRAWVAVDCVDVDCAFSQSPELERIDRAGRALVAAEKASNEWAASNGLPAKDLT